MNIHDLLAVEDTETIVRNEKALFRIDRLPQEIQSQIMSRLDRNSVKQLLFTKKALSVIGRSALLSEITIDCALGVYGSSGFTFGHQFPPVTAPERLQGLKFLCLKNFICAAGQSTAEEEQDLQVRLFMEEWLPDALRVSCMSANEMCLPKSI